MAEERGRSTSPCIYPLRLFETYIGVLAGNQSRFSLLVLTVLMLCRGNCWEKQGFPGGPSKSLEGIRARDRRRPKRHGWEPGHSPLF